MGMRDRPIKEFLDSYWKLPSNINLEAYEVKDLEEHDIHLTKKYGGETVGRLIKLRTSYAKEPSVETHQKLTDFLYESGLQEEAFPIILNHGRKTLEFLLGHLSKKQEPFSLVDLGSGTGKIAIGLSLYLDNLRKIYAIDKSPFAKGCLENNLNSLGPSDKEKANSKLTYIEGDFFSEETSKKVSEKELDGVDVALLAYSPFNIGELDKEIPSLINNRGEMITCSHLRMPEFVRYKNIFDQAEFMQFSADQHVGGWNNEFGVFCNLDFGELGVLPLTDLNFCVITQGKFNGDKKE